MVAMMMVLIDNDHDVDRSVDRSIATIATDGVPKTHCPWLWHIRVESTQKVYQVGAEKSRLSFYSIPKNGINRAFFIPKPLTE
jgi:hypothetical protein